MCRRVPPRRLEAALPPPAPLHPSPLRPAAGVAYTSISVPWIFSAPNCAVREADGELDCWGGQEGYGEWIMGLDGGPWVAAMRDGPVE